MVEARHGIVAPPSSSEILERVGDKPRTSSSIPAAALARSSMRINAGSFQVGVPQGGRNECDGCAGARTASRLMRS